MLLKFKIFFLQKVSQRNDTASKQIHRNCFHIKRTSTVPLFAEKNKAPLHLAVSSGDVKILHLLAM